MNISELHDNFRDHEMERIRAKKARDAAVLIPLVEDDDGKAAVLFEVRSRRIIQGGEVCFPGGRVEKGETPAEAAVREAREELKLEASDITLIAPMFSMNGISDSSIYSYLGSIANYKRTYSKDEVDSIFTVGIDELLKMQPKYSRADFVFGQPEDFHYELVPGGRDYSWSKRIKDYYFYETKHGVIWGMTGEILHSFIESIRPLHQG